MGTPPGTSRCGLRPRVRRPQDWRPSKPKPRRGTEAEVSRKAVAFRRRILTTVRTEGSPCTETRTRRGTSSPAGSRPGPGRWAVTSGLPDVAQEALPFRGWSRDARSLLQGRRGPMVRPTMVGRRSQHREHPPTVASRQSAKKKISKIKICNYICQDFCLTRPASCLNNHAGEGRRRPRSRRVGDDVGAGVREMEIEGIEVHFDEDEGHLRLDCGEEEFEQIRDLVVSKASATDRLGPCVNVIRSIAVRRRAALQDTTPGAGPDCSASSSSRWHCPPRSRSRSSASLPSRGG